MQNRKKYSFLFKFSKNIKTDNTCSFAVRMCRQEGYCEVLDNTEVLIFKNKVKEKSYYNM